mmetsp:Transcript_40241/g.72860  ORF Transcript_40241/g.72860 Transcript_40241/m.72860 type:complete len:200 (-) Transcript_40241:189-788(-)
MALSASMELFTGTMCSLGLFKWCSSVRSSELLNGGAFDRMSCWKAFVTSSLSSCTTAGKKSSKRRRSKSPKTGTSSRGFCVSLYSRVTASPKAFGKPSLSGDMSMCKTFKTKRSVSPVAFCTSTKRSGSVDGMCLMASSMELMRCSFISSSHCVKVSTKACNKTGRLMHNAKYSQTLSFGLQTAPVKISFTSFSICGGT